MGMIRILSFPSPPFFSSAREFVSFPTAATVLFSRPPNSPLGEVEHFSFFPLSLSYFREKGVRNIFPFSPQLLNVSFFSLTLPFPILCFVHLSRTQGLSGFFYAQDNFRRIPPPPPPFFLPSICLCCTWQFFCASLSSLISGGCSLALVMVKASPLLSVRDPHAATHDVDDAHPRSRNAYHIP